MAEEAAVGDLFWTLFSGPVKFPLTRGVPNQGMMP